MYVDLVKIEYLGDYRLELKFKNGKMGVIDFKRYIKLGGVYARLADPVFFKKAYVDKEVGVLCWPGGVDVAPETLYHEATGEPLPDWMIREGPEKKKEKRRKAV
jgi:hypothetical protein